MGSLPRMTKVRAVISRPSVAISSAWSIGAARVMRSIQRGPSTPMMRTMPPPPGAEPTTSRPQGPYSTTTSRPSLRMPWVISFTVSRHWPARAGAANATGVHRPCSVKMCSIFGPSAPISTCTSDLNGRGMSMDPRLSIPVEKSEKSKSSMFTESPSKGPESPSIASWTGSGVSSYSSPRMAPEVEVAGAVSGAESVGSAGASPLLL